MAGQVDHQDPPATPNNPHGMDDEEEKAGKHEQLWDDPESHHYEVPAIGRLVGVIVLGVVARCRLIRIDFGLRIDLGDLGQSAQWTVRVCVQVNARTHICICSMYQHGTKNMMVFFLKKKNCIGSQAIKHTRVYIHTFRQAGTRKHTHARTHARAHAHTLKLLSSRLPLFQIHTHINTPIHTNKLRLPSPLSSFPIPLSYRHTHTHARARAHTHKQGIRLH